MLGYQLDFAMEEFGKLFGMRQPLVEQIITMRKFHQEIHIAIVTFLAARD